MGEAVEAISALAFVLALFYLLGRGFIGFARRLDEIDQPDNSLRLRFNAAEFQRIQERARAEGFSPQAWCKMAVGNAIHDEDHTVLRPAWVEAKFAKLNAERAESDTP